MMNNFDTKKLLHKEITQLELTIYGLYVATEMILIIILNIRMNFTCYINGLITLALFGEREMYIERVLIKYGFGLGWCVGIS